MAARIALLVLLLLLAAAPLRAQEDAPVQPGAVATVVITEPAESDTVQFELAPKGGARLFSARSGSVVAENGVARVVVTVGVPAGALGGPLTVGRLRLTGTAGGAVEREVVVRVAERRRVELALEADTVTAVASRLTDVPLRVENRGNTGESVELRLTAPGGWTAEAIPNRVELAPGERLEAALHLIPPGTAEAATLHNVRVQAVAADLSTVATLTVVTVGEDAWLADLEQIPGSIFVGSSTGPESGPGVAVRASGRAGAETRVDLAIRRTAERSPPTAFRRELAGPRLHLGLSAPGLDLNAGDLYARADVFSGSLQQVRGVQAAVARGGVGAQGTVAVPWSYGGAEPEGRLLQLGAGVETAAGRLGLRFSSLERRVSQIEDYAIMGGGATYSRRGDAHSLEAAAGFLHVRSGSSERSGFAGSASYRFNGSRGSISARLRATPATTQRTAGLGREAYLSGILELTPAISLTGWGFAMSAPLVDDGPYPTQRGTSVGLRFRLPRRVRAELRGELRESDVIGDALASSTARSITAGLDVPLGAGLRMEADLTGGTVAGPRDRRFRSLRTGIRWHSTLQWAWVGFSSYDTGFGSARPRLDVAGAVRILNGELQGGLNLALERGTSRPLALWSGVELPLTRDFDLLTGAEYGRTATQDLRFSFGVRRRIGVPLPVRRAPVVEGVVFEDRDGDLLRGPDEPLLPGVELRFGALRTTTDEEGRFQFFDRTEGPLRVVPSSLGMGMAVPASVYLPSAGRVEIPVVRTATLHLDLFLDRDGDGLKDDAEQPSARTMVSLVEGPGAQRDALTDTNGRVRFSGLQPGVYTVRVVRGEGSHTEAAVEVGPGERATLLLPLPQRTREIRLQSGEVLQRPVADEPVRQGTTLRPAPPAREPERRPSADAPAEERARRVLFQFGSARISDEATDRIRDVAEELERDPTLVVRVVGHADAIGPAAYNRTLSERRAVAVAALLRALDVDSDRIRTTGAGEREPVASNSTPQGRRLNRRAEILLERAASAP